MWWWRNSQICQFKRQYWIYVLSKGHSQFTKTAPDPPYQLHVWVNIPQDGDDLQTYAQNYTGNYVVAYGVIGEMSEVDSDKTYDYRTAYDIQPTKVVMNVDLDMN